MFTLRASWTRELVRSEHALCVRRMQIVALESLTSANSYHSQETYAVSPSPLFNLICARAVAQSGR